MPPRLRPLPLQPPISFPPHQCCCACTRPFSSTRPNATRQRQAMFRWLTGPGQVFKNPLPGSTNYLNAYDRSGNLIRARRIDSREDDAASASAAKETTVDDEGREFESEDAGREKEKDKGKGKERGQIGLPREKQEDLMPFPMNRQFQSQPVLSEEFKDAIWKRIREEGRSVRDVSAMMGVEMRRVAAVVRLKEVERNWEAEGKPFATPYFKAITAMLPTTTYSATAPTPHESINDLPVHRATTLQLFAPAAESRHFTRRDAGLAFARGLLPAEDRVPHTELVTLARWAREGVQADERAVRMRGLDGREEEAKRMREGRRRERVEKETRRVEGGRAVFRFRDVKVDEVVGGRGRGREGVGARYGVPAQDRKKGQVKIPTRVE